MKLRLTAIGILILMGMSGQLSAQDSTKVSTDSVSTGALNIIVDCSSCDQDYFRTEITFVNFVRDRAMADVNILITRQETGALGIEHTLEFIGQKTFDGMRDTLTFISKESDSKDAVREGLVRTIKLGLVRFASKTPVSHDLSVSYSRPAAVQIVKDPWDHWIFSISIDGSVRGQRSTRQLYLFNQVTAQRTTEKNKIYASAYYQYEENNYDFEDFKLTSISRGRGASASYVIGIDNHWSTGIDAGISSSLFSNTKIRPYLGAGLEFNVFPYAASTHRQLRLQYWLYELYAQYYQVTIFDRLHAWLTKEELAAAVSFNRPWGTVSASVSGSHYFHDFDRNRLTLQGNLSLKVVSGLSLTANGWMTWVHDQLSLSAAGATHEEILLQRRQLATSYEYWVSFGVSYTFGSIYNTIVNPRFGN